MKNKVLISFANGQDHIDMLSVALSSFYHYANRYGYDVAIPSQQTIYDAASEYGWDCNRPPSWSKIVAIKHMLQFYDTVLWIDSDVVINKFDKDIAENFDDEFMHAFVVHSDRFEGRVPNCGVWLLNKNAIEFLSEIWNQTDFINHKWWEQGAMIHLISNNKHYFDLSLELPYEFNVHKNDIRFNDQEYLQNGRFLHATMWNNRLNKMKEWANHK